MDSALTDPPLERTSASELAPRVTTPEQAILSRSMMRNSISEGTGNGLNRR